MSIKSSGVSYGGDTQQKYIYITRPFDFTNIVFEIRNITLDGAGYYNGGTLAAWSGGGVVLIVSASGNLLYERFKQNKILRF